MFVTVAKYNNSVLTFIEVREYCTQKWNIPIIKEHCVTLYVVADNISDDLFYS